MTVGQFMRNWWAWAADMVAELADDDRRAAIREGIRAGVGDWRRRVERPAQPNKVELAMAMGVERALIARYLRERAKLYAGATRALLDSEANRIAGGMHYR